MAEARARLMKYPTSPRKMRYVVDMIRGMDVEKAMNVLQHASKAGAKPLGKLLGSAIDNWVRKEAVEAENEKRTATRVEDAQLFVKVVYVDGGAMLKRWLPAPHGRAFKKRKRSNHITIIVDSKVLMAEGKKKGVVEAKAETPAETETVQVSSGKGEAPKKKASTRKKKEVAVAQ